MKSLTLYEKLLGDEDILIGDLDISLIRARLGQIYDISKIKDIKKTDN